MKNCGKLNIIIFIFTFHRLTQLYGFDFKAVSKEIWENTKKPFDGYYEFTDLEEYPRPCRKYSDENCAKKWLKLVDGVRLRNKNRLLNVQFGYSTNVSTVSLNLLNEFIKKQVSIEQILKSDAQKFQWKTFPSKYMRKRFDSMTENEELKNDTILKEINKINSKISFIYNNARPCYKTCLSPGENSIVDLFSKERDYEKLIGFWVAWRDSTGAKIRKLFIDRMNLENQITKESYKSDLASLKFFGEFHDENFKNTLVKVYDEIAPLYKELHAYVRYCLAKYYPGRFDENGSIPAHILGNVWAQQWLNILPIIRQCSGFKTKDNFVYEVNENLAKISLKDMFVLAERFFQSIGMYNMTNEFWERSMFSQPRERIVDCHSTSYDFSNGRDYRITMCTKKNLDDFIVIHHEMGHIQYYMAYRNLPLHLRSSPNAGFHEAIGDTIALSVSTPEHLLKIGLLSQIPNTTEFDINYLLAVALEKIVFLPFALTMDMFLWNVYNGSVSTSHLNEYWWNLTYKYQGLKPPIARSEKDFDPGSKYHVAYGISYIRYFFSFIVQFQFFESMCVISGYEGPLHRCDFYKSKLAGSKLLEMLRQGGKVPWKKSLKILTGDDNLKSNSLLKFFDPLYRWLKRKNEHLKIQVGW